MWNNLIGGHIRRTNRLLLAVNAGIVFALLAFTVWQGRYLFNFLLGPFPTDRKTLVSITDPDETFDYYVTVEGKPVPPTMGKEVEQRVNKYTKKVESERVVAEYVVVHVSNRALVVKVPGTANMAEQQFTGKLVQLPPDMRNKLIQSPEARRLHLDEFFLPYMLDATGFRTPGWIGLAICLPLYVVGIWNITRALRRMARPERHPIGRALARLGKPAEVAAAIETEIKEDGRVPVGSVTLTRSWFLRPTTFGMDVIHAAELVWIYKKMTKHSTNGIPTGTTFATVIHTRYGGAVEVAGNERLTESLLQELFQRAPWVLAGFDEQLAGYWKSDPGGVVAAVDDRRRQVLGEQVLDAKPVPANAEETGPTTSDQSLN